MSLCTILRNICNYWPKRHGVDPTLESSAAALREPLIAQKKFNSESRNVAVMFKCDFAFFLQILSSSFKCAQMYVKRARIIAVVIIMMIIIIIIITTSSVLRLVHSLCQSEFSG